jgi:hypothetical protein
MMTQRSKQQARAIGQSMASAPTAVFSRKDRSTAARVGEATVQAQQGQAAPEVPEPIPVDASHDLDYNPRHPRTCARERCRCRGRTRLPG